MCQVKKKNTKHKMKYVVNISVVHKNYFLFESQERM